MCFDALFHGDLFAVAGLLVELGAQTGEGLGGFGGAVGGACFALADAFVMVEAVRVG